MAQARGKSRTVGEIMTREVSWCAPDATVQEVARVMAERNVGAVPIAEDGRLVGLVTDRDIAVRVVARGLDVRQTRIGDHVTREVEAVTPTTPIDTALGVMERYQVRRLPVVEEGRLVGIVSLGDFATRTPGSSQRRELKVGEALEAISQPSEAR
ncbi:MAG TPA: CBS domain-containing protein [Thermodesulfobacteriota bacterium]|nr:CBS domain-containing protein [Thermodesulfobacteriota bacterium]